MRAVCAGGSQQQGGSEEVDGAACLSPWLVAAAVERMCRQFKTRLDNRLHRRHSRRRTTATMGAALATSSSRPRGSAAASMDGDREEAVSEASSSAEKASGLSAADLDLVGEWRTRFGLYTVTNGGSLGLLFEEPETRYRGVLKPDGEWAVAEVYRPPGAEEAAWTLHGYIRLRREGEDLQSSFASNMSVPWKPAPWGKRLPYADLFAYERDPHCREDDVESCCICLDEVEDGESAARLLCDHVYHRECVQKWFGKHGSCPFRCPASNCVPRSPRQQQAAAGL